jgi:hypothetical protein
MEQPLANKNNLPMTTNRTGSQENLKGRFSALEWVKLHWNTATVDRNIANSLKEFAREFFKSRQR